VVHVHNLLNLSFDLPRLARERGAAVVATVHDYTLVCPSGGQRVHVAEQHVCTAIDPERCSRCFVQSPLHAQMSAGRLTRGPGGRTLARAGRLLHRMAPAAATLAVRAIPAAGTVTAADVRRRLASARQVFESIDLFVAPSRSVATELVRLGLDARRLETSDYGFSAGPRRERSPRDARLPLRIGFVGTLVWHKGAHVLLAAVRLLEQPVEVHLHGDTAVFPEYVARLRDAAAGLPVTFHGGFARTRVREIFAGLDVLAVPSLWPENSPLVIHEAFLHGVPVVASRIGGIQDLVTDEVDGLLADPFSAEALHAALARLSLDADLRSRLAAAAPPVKTIVQDAAEWEGRYAALRRTSAGAARYEKVPAGTA
jgi:glycosyltransferase involved in cell wall biosynthesis